MLRHRRESKEAGVDMTAFADIAFLLIIFFILTTTFIKTAGSRLDIPAGQENQEKSEEKHTLVILTATGIRYGEEGRKVSLEKLRELLAEKKFGERDKDERTVILESSPEVAYQDYFDVVMAIDKAQGVLTFVDRGEDS